MRSHCTGGTLGRAYAPAACGPGLRKLAAGKEEQDCVSEVCSENGSQAMHLPKEQRGGRWILRAVDGERAIRLPQENRQMGERYRSQQNQKGSEAQLSTI